MGSIRIAILRVEAMGIEDIAGSVWRMKCVSAGVRSAVATIDGEGADQCVLKARNVAGCAKGQESTFAYGTTDKIVNVSSHADVCIRAHLPGTADVPACRLEQGCRRSGLVLHRRNSYGGA